MSLMDHEAPSLGYLIIWLMLTNTTELGKYILNMEYIWHLSYNNIKIQIKQSYKKKT